MHYGGWAAPHTKSLRQQRWERQQELERLRQAGRDAAPDAQLTQRIAAIEQRIAGQRERLDAVDTAAGR